MNKFPTLFIGHGSPMIALENTEATKTLQKLGQKIIQDYGIPKAILAISAHWYTDATYTQTAPEPEQIYDMYGFPQELYQVKYPVTGSKDLSTAILKALGHSVSINNSWGIDHGIWTLLVHIFPQASIPVVQVSVSANLNPQEAYQIGQKLAGLRSQGYLILGSGNIVHNLRCLEWDNPGGSPQAIEFDQSITKAVLSKDIDTLINYQAQPHAAYAVPTPDHFLPLLYVLGASQDSSPKVFNQTYNTGALSMTSFIFED